MWRIVIQFIKFSKKIKEALTGVSVALLTKRARANEKVFMGSVISAARRVIPQGSAPKAKKEERQKEKETVIKAKAKERGIGERVCGRLTERKQESGNGNSQKKKSQQGALGQLGERPRREPTSMRRGMRRSEGQGQELWGST